MRKVFEKTVDTFFFFQTTTNHAVVIVGYGNDAKSGKDFWIVIFNLDFYIRQFYLHFILFYSQIRNSWGPEWGEGMRYSASILIDVTKSDNEFLIGGYINLERGVNMCAVSKRAVFPTAGY